MRRVRGLGEVAAIALVLVVTAGGCSDDSDKSATRKTPTEKCAIRPGGQCANADLAGRNLTAAKLAGADLEAANLSGANLTNANLSGANLSSANLTNATLVNTDLRAANLAQANFAGATLSGVTLADARRCGTIRTDGSIDNTSCPPPADATTSTGAPAAATTTSTASTTTNCNSQAFAVAVASQGGYYGLSEQVLQSTNPTGLPACSTSFATQNFIGPAAPNGPGEFKAVFSIAPKNGWHLLGVTGCQPAMSIPPDQAGGIC